MLQLLLLTDFGCQVTDRYSLIVYYLSVGDRQPIDIFILGWQDAILQAKCSQGCPKIAGAWGGINLFEFGSAET